jgi:Xaa-Pro dipeptidase
LQKARAARSPFPAAHRDAMMAPMDMLGLYPAHVREIAARHEAAAARGGVDAIVTGSGIVQYRYLDDQAHRFVASPHFLQWVPLEEHPGSAVIFEPGRRPVLVVHQPEDFWHQPPALPPEAVAACFDVAVVRSPEELARHLPGADRRVALLGPPEQFAGMLPEAARNPEAVVHSLHYRRALKTPWEVACMRRAAEIAAPGHRAAEAAFRAGGSEYDILAAFLGGCRQTEQELPYGAIVALNEHGATLHYQHRARTPPRPRDIHSLLIDAGCQYNGYACDITRTYAYRDDRFAAMVADMDGLQRALCAAVRPGVAFPDLHRRTHLGIAELLSRWGIVRGMAAADMVAAGITAAFFPHGLGHLLGILVHDVGGHMADDRGTALVPPADFPKIRFLRTLEPGVVVTIEPGVYFIDSLLTVLARGPAAGHVDFDLVGELRRYGGIRIEDDVLVTGDGANNLTRPLLGG